MRAAASIMISIALVACASSIRPRKAWQHDLTLEEFRHTQQAFIPRVERPNTLPLGTSVEAWAAYIAAVHRQIHMQFAHGFLPALPSRGVLADPSLSTTIELVIDSSGGLERLGIVTTSGVELYDWGAFSAVRQGAPYPPPPVGVRSKDGRAYLRWTLHRNESQCGPWNAEPFMLKTVKSESSTSVSTRAFSF